MDPQPRVQNSKTQANTLGLLLYIYAGIQGLFVLFMLAAVMFYGVTGVLAVSSGGNKNLNGAAVMAIIVVVYALMFLFGLVSMFFNIKSARELRNENRIAGKNMLLTASILNTVNFLAGGVCLLPFGVAMGVYGLWFIFSETGIRYFGAGSSRPPSPIEYFEDR